MSQASGHGSEEFGAVQQSTFSLFCIIVLLELKQTLLILPKKQYDNLHSTNILFLNCEMSRRLQSDFK